MDECIAMFISLNVQQPVTCMQRQQMGMKSKKKMSKLIKAKRNTEQHMQPRESENQWKEKWQTFDTASNTRKIVSFFAFFLFSHKIDKYNCMLFTIDWVVFKCISASIAHMHQNLWLHFATKWQCELVKAFEMHAHKETNETVQMWRTQWRNVWKI